MTGLFHDDDGNVDDRRIAGWVLVASAITAGILAIFAPGEANSASEIALGFMWGGIALMGVTVGEKFKRTK